MKCPKCPGHLSETATKKGAHYSWCALCKGIWVHQEDLQIIFDHAAALRPDGLKLLKAVETSFSCPDCQCPLRTGSVLRSQLEIDECADCQSYFFDPKEMNKLFQVLQSPDLPQAGGLQLQMENVTKLAALCPVCKDQPLWGGKKDSKKFQACLQCGGLQTTVEALQSLAERSLFSPTMFTFRDSQGAFAVCRSCATEQDPANQSCLKCGRAISKLDCNQCSSQMSEYFLNSIVIERCQLCNIVWLDEQEFEKIMTALPDMKKHYEESRRKSELFSTEIKASSHAYSLGLDITKRKMADRFWGRYSLFFY